MFVSCQVSSNMAIFKQNNGSERAKGVRGFLQHGGDAGVALW